MRVSSYTYKSKMIKHNLIIAELDERFSLLPSHITKIVYDPLTKNDRHQKLQWVYTTQRGNTQCNILARIFGINVADALRGSIHCGPTRRGDSKGQRVSLTRSTYPGRVSKCSKVQRFQPQRRIASLD